MVTPVAMPPPLFLRGCSIVRATRLLVLMRVVLSPPEPRRCAWPLITRRHDNNGGSRPFAVFFLPAFLLLVRARMYAYVRLQGPALTRRYPHDSQV